MTQDNISLRDRQLGDFAHVDAADSDDLVARLDTMHTLDSFKIYKEETFDILRAQPGSRLADIGCGTGEDARHLAERVAPNGEVVGFDLSEAMLRQARERHGAVSGLSFIQGPSDQLDAPTSSFDGARADRVLIHVPNPMRTLEEMIRITKPGGRIVVSEPDMPGCWVASNDYALTDRIMQEIAKSCVTPYLARDLWAMFHDAGLKNVSLAVRTVLVFNPASVARILDFEGVVRGMLTRNLLTSEEVTQWTEDFAERGRQGRFAAAVCIMIAAGTKD
jgi:ubiquinone/menaquinone biosynthesis C-methylase UbiE